MRKRERQPFKSEIERETFMGEMERDIRDTRQTGRKRYPSQRYRDTFVRTIERERHS